MLNPGPNRNLSPNLNLNPGPNLNLNSNLNRNPGPNPLCEREITVEHETYAPEVRVRGGEGEGEGGEG